jgi:MFS family permease
MPLLFQIGFGLSPFRSGLLLLVSALGNLGMKALTTSILRRYGFRRVAIVDCVLSGVFTIACGLLTPESPLMWILFVVFAYGLTRSMQFSTLATLAYADVPPEQTSAANTLWNAATQMCIGLGIAFGAVALRAASAINGKGAGNVQVFTLDERCQRCDYKVVTSLLRCDLRRTAADTITNTPAHRNANRKSRMSRKLSHCSTR